MAIGSAIVLFVIGAVLTYGVDAEIAGLDIDTIGYILMGAGVVGGLIGLLYAMTYRGRGTAVVDAPPRDVVVETPPREVVVEREYRR
jgi:hypothetical protein